MDFTQLPLSHGYKFVLVMVCMFSHWTEKPSTADKLLSLLWLKSFWKRLSLPDEILLNLMIEEPILLARYFNKPVLFGWFYNTFTMLTTLNSLI